MLAVEELAEEADARRAGAPEDEDEGCHGGSCGQMKQHRERGKSGCFKVLMAVVDSLELWECERGSWARKLFIPGRV